MDLQTLLSYEWGIMAPEFVILGMATLLSLIDLFMGAKKSRKPLALIGLAGIIIALIFLVSQIGHEPVDILYGTYIFDPFSQAFKFLFLIGTAFVLLLGYHYEPSGGIEYRGEFYYLLMTALLGTMIMASSADLITLFVGLELLSISSFILAGLRKKNLQSNEAAMKYMINGGIASAITIFGMSYIYGLTGSTNLYEIGERTGNIMVGDLAFLTALAFIITFIGLSFKIATVPYQMWAPDVYQGSPTPVTAFLSVVSKTAGFVIIIRLLITAFNSAPGLTTEDYNLLWSMKPFLAVLAALTMIVGNTIALRQTNIKRLFGFSSIAHAGYLLVPFISLSPLWLEGIWFYLVAYLLMNLGAFAIIQHVTDRAGSEELSSFNGLYKRAPIIAVAMAIFMLSLAGIPGTAGFIGKLNIFIGALGPITAFGPFPGHLVLVSIMMATTVISYFYYFRVMKVMFSGQPAVVGINNVALNLDSKAETSATESTSTESQQVLQGSDDEDASTAAVSDGKQVTTGASIQKNTTATGSQLPIGISIVVGLCVIGTILFGIAPGLALDFFYTLLGM
ncbi:NADH-quinone oxidoreductase subunit NuoN [Calidifontibacillus oryziterrae]|uniref:NADH-quinone oxidoreductase subunit NuoN n=1 Tax=Calidifontibacillus oryziterrae TaxID=1191699 RepID=UPI00031E1800|nr:NADH-quinone oxidoreductase subunit NuoN [Calidifontibacillus oryziterrae]